MKQLTKYAEHLMVAQIQECLIEFIDNFMSLYQYKKKSSFMDDELPLNVINAIYF